jgi:two-component system sensor histidine kinase PilS (NtrC family)
MITNPIKQLVCRLSPVNLEEDVQLRRQLLWVLFFRVVLLSFLLGIIVFFQYNDATDYQIIPLHLVGIFIGGVYLFTISSAFAIRFVPCSKPFAYIQISLDVLITSVLVFFSGGSQSFLIIIYFFPIISGATLLLRRGALFMAAQASLMYGGILWIEYSGNMAAYFPSSSLGQFMMTLPIFSISGLSFFLTAFLSAFMAERLKVTETALTQTILDRDRLAVLYKQILDDITTGIITINGKKIITSFNIAAEKISGFSAPEAVGKSLEDLMPEIMADLRGEIRPLAILTRKNGEKIPVGYSWTRLNMPGDNDHYRVYTMQDLSLIKKMEYKVRQSEKMAAIGRMAAGIAHEFRNPLAAMSGAAQVLEKDLPADSTTHALMNIIIRESDKLEATIHGFLEFSRPVEPVMDWFSLKGLTEEAINMAQNDPYWHDVEVDLIIPSAMDCWADANQLRQVLINLITNAVHALNKIENPRLTIKAQEKNEGEKPWLVVDIADNGPGIPDNVKNHIFDPFFTTRESGTGLGLSIVNQIIESHEGTLTVNSDSTGTCFSISLPLP